MTNFKDNINYDKYNSLNEMIEDANNDVINAEKLLSDLLKALLKNNGNK